ncbi:MAG: L-sorbose 1-phosphate reductase [Spirochaetales bacterium]|nr:L-sorbose 1-phosphate reductase [Spirochaetales bacterium]
MKTKAVRLYGKMDLRLEEFELPETGNDQILARIVSDSICLSSYKAAKQGEEHKRVPDNVSENPVMIGHEFCGEIVSVGHKWQGSFEPGQKFSIQPALNYKGTLDAPGYSFPYTGGDATHIIIPNEVMEMNCLLNYQGDAFFMGSLSEPMSCIAGTFHAMYHTSPGRYEHTMGIVDGGTMALLAGAGPMGLGTIDYAIHTDRKPRLLIVTDIDQARLDRVASIYSPKEAKKNGVELIYVNTKGIDDVVSHLKSFNGGKGYDDVLVFASVRAVVEQADAILGRDGCLNFFAGPTDTEFSAELNFYNVHYGSTHVVGTSGGNTDDMIEALDLMANGVLNPVAMITHIGGLNAVVETTKHLMDIPGGKKLIYTNVDMELTAIDDFRKKGETNEFFKDLADIVETNNGLWSIAAERYLMDHAEPI